MDNRERAALFTKYVGLELKGRITSQDWTALRVAQTLGRSPSAFNRWLNGKAELPLGVLCEVAETIGIEPHDVIDTAYDRMVVRLGETDGTTYDDAEDAEEQMRERDVARSVHDEIDNITALPVHRSAGRMAANRNKRKGDETPHAE